MNLQRLNELYLKNQPINGNDIDNLLQLTKDYPYFQKPFVILARHYFETNHYKFDDMLRQAAMRVKDRKELYRYIHDHIPSTKLVDGANPSDNIHYDTESIALNFQHQQAQEIKPGIDDFLAESEGSLDTSPFHETQIIQTISEINTHENAYHSLENGSLSSELPASDNENDAAKNADQAFIENLDEYKDFGTGEIKPETEKPFEFKFEGRSHAKDLAETGNEKVIAGEEIAAEFTFSKSFFPTQLDEPENSTEALEEEIDANILATDNREKSEMPDSKLREHPEHSIETYNPGSSGEIAESESSNEKDFFTWLSHPEMPDNATEKSNGNDGTKITEIQPNKTLDIIERFISVNPKISRPKKEFYNPENMAKKSEILDEDFVSETLANIYYEQGNYDLAIRSYEKLSLQNPLKQAYFADLIEKIKKERK